MKILITGSSGLIGSALVTHLRAAGHDVVRLLRQPCEQADAFEWNPDTGVIDQRAFAGVSGVVHLGGVNIGSKRWSAKSKRLIMESRVAGTRLISSALAARVPRPRVMVCASAVGFYGDRADAVLDESSPGGEGFLASVASQWEKASEPAAAAGVRVASVRLGMVLSAEGGALPRMLLPFRLGLGGAVGGGRQYISWVAIQDVVEAVQYILENDSLSGPVNLVAPDSVTNRQFGKALGAALHRPACLPLPAFAVKALFGEMGRELLLTSTRAVPSKLLSAGYAFRYPVLAGALERILGARCSSSHTGVSPRDMNVSSCNGSGEAGTDARPQALLLLGPTGAGKTPLGDALAAGGLCGHRCIHFDFGANLRAADSGALAVDALTPGDRSVIRAALATGRLLEDGQFPIAAAIFRAFLGREAWRPGVRVVLNGVPRHAGQARDVAALADVRDVVLLECSPAVVLERIRRDTGGDRAGRIDDSLPEVERKLDLFRLRTLPLLDHYAGLGVSIHRLPVRADTTATDAAAALSAALERANG